ncbi:MAG: 6-carboxytetrahydropterin synthase [Pseudomonadota bacterium]|nr:6-carboxytetrahydropterin synthase [Pseudomonadota bacterium]
MSTLFVKGLTVVDFSYLHAQRGLLGESWRLDISLTGELDQQGMVLDFSAVKRQVKQLVDLEFDHKLIVPLKSSAVALTQHREHCIVFFEYGDCATIEHHSPASALCLLPAARVSRDTVAAAITDSLLKEMPANVSQLEIMLSPEHIEGSFYHYSHGLKHHAGNCQRIAHGHRSIIEIRRNGVRDPRLESDWAAKWRDIYIGNSEDLISEEDGQHRYRYQASQGHFTLKLPAKCCYDINNDSTIENLAQHIADSLKQQHPDSAFEVFAYEGIGKGAVGRS